MMLNTLPIEFQQFKISTVDIRFYFKSLRREITSLLCCHFALIHLLQNCGHSLIHYNKLHSRVYAIVNNKMTFLTLTYHNHFVSSLECCIENNCNFHSYKKQTLSGVLAMDTTFPAIVDIFVGTIQCINFTLIILMPQQNTTASLST